MNFRVPSVADMAREDFHRDIWQPLESFAIEHPEVQPVEFMMMGTATAENGRQVFAYKHINTRRYLNIDRSGAAYAFDGDTYVPADTRRALLWLEVAR